MYSNASSRGKSYEPPSSALGVLIFMIFTIFTIFMIVEFLVNYIILFKMARDILLVEMGGKAYLFVGLGDGRLITYTVDFSGDLPSLVNRRNGVLGTHPITFSCFYNAGSLCVFAASDRPTIIYSKNGKVIY